MQVFLLAQAMRMRGHEVAVCRLVDKPDDFVDRLHEHSIPTTSFGMQRHAHVFYALMQARRWVTHWKPDLVHSHMVHSNLFARVLRLFVTYPRLVSTIHSFYDGGHLRMLAYRLTDRLGDLTTSVSLAAAKRHVSIGACSRERMIFIPNCINTDVFRPDPEARSIARRALGIYDKVVYLAVGRMEHPKNFHLLISSFAEIAYSGGAVLLLAGDGPDRPRLEALSTQLGIQESVLFLRRRDDMPNLMNAADCFVLCSAWEGMPLVVLEALACNKKIVSTDFPGVQELIGDAGLVTPYPDGKALTDAMKRVLTVPLDPVPRERILSYGQRSVAERWEHEYTQLLFGL